MRTPVGPYDVANVSGADWDGAHMRPRGRELAPQPEPGPLSHREPVMIDAESGQALAGFGGRALTSTVRRYAIRRAIDQSHPAAQPDLDYLFGVGLPGR